jgi:hypothetical protein
LRATRCFIAIGATILIASCGGSLVGQISDPCADQWCSDSLPGLGTLRAIWGFSERDVWVGGDSGVAHWNGRRWEYAQGPDFEVLGLWGASSNDLWAVGLVSYGNGVIAHWNGLRWTNANNQYLSMPPRGLWGLSSTDVWVVGGLEQAEGPEQIVLHWDGGDWAQALDRQGRFNVLTSIWGSSATDLWTSDRYVIPLGEAEGTMLHWDGAQWSEDNFMPLFSATIWGTNANDVWAVGTDIFHFDGESWAQVPWPHEFSDFAFIVDVRGNRPDNVWAIGRKGMEDERKGIMLHWNGFVWNSVDPVTDSDPGALWVSASGDVWFVSDSAVFHHSKLSPPTRELRLAQ